MRKNQGKKRGEKDGMNEVDQHTITIVVSSLNVIAKMYKHLA
jgi:hypothetical protein